MATALVLAALSPALLPTPAPASPSYGSVDARDGRLREGCRAHAYSYRLTPPEGDWTLETFLVGPGGHALASDQLAEGFDPAVGKKRFRICRATTRPGRFRVKALLIVDNGPNETTEAWLPTASFRLRKG